MIRRLLYRYTAHRPARLISRDGTPYLERYYLGRLLGLTFYLHRFVSGDGEAEVHDHPWRAVSIVLAGAYSEERSLLDPRDGWQSRYRRVRFINALGLRSFHRVAWTLPDTWTLFIHGRRRKGWGFLRHLPDPGLPNDAVLYYQPFDLTERAWWKTAALGREIGREPLKESEGK